MCRIDTMAISKQLINNILRINFDAFIESKQKKKLLNIIAKPILFPQKIV
jgi:hypothetical protein